MKKKIFITAILIYLFSITNVNATMAHNIYSNPQFNRNDIYDTFMIDFQGTQTPYYTYWALCNWQMDLTKFKSSHSDVSGGGAYAGLQANGGGKRSAIMSFWEVSYNGGQIQRAKMVYPNKETNSFGGEGEGSNYITDYNWKNNQWYRMVLHSWDNRNTGTTYVAQWFLDVSSGQWNLISVFDTKLPSSGLTGGFSQFQENYVGSTKDQVREFYFKNMYARKKSNQYWYSLNTTELTYDTKAFGYDTAGRHEFGVRNNSFYGLSGGTVSNQDQYDKQQPERSVLSINQSTIPPITTASVNINVSNNNNNVTISWNYNAPQIEYVIYIKDRDGNRINTISSVDPVTRQITINDDSANHIYELYVKDIFGNTSWTKSTPKDNSISKSNNNQNNESIIENNADEKVEEQQEPEQKKEKNVFKYLAGSDKKQEYSSNRVNKGQSENKSAYIISFLIIANSIAIIIVSAISIIKGKRKKNNK